MGRKIWNPKTGKFEEQYTIPLPPKKEPAPSPRSIWQPVTIKDVEKRKAEEKKYREAKQEAKKPKPIEAPPLNPFEKGLVAHGKYDIARSSYEKRTGFKFGEAPGKKYPSGITARYAGMDKEVDLGFDKEPDFVSRPVQRTTPFDIEKQAGFEAGLTPSTVQERKIGAIHQQQLKEWEDWSAHKRKLDTTPHARDISRTFSTFLGGFASPDYIMAHIQGDVKKQENIIKDWEYGVWRSGYKPHGTDDMMSRFFTGFITAAPTRYVIAPLVTGSVMGAGMGALSAAYPTAGRIAQYGLGGYMGISTGASLLTSKEPYKDLLGIAISLPSMLLGYRKGYHFGYGRTEAYLYKIHTYSPGSSEWIRFEKGLKVGRLLERVPSIKKKPLDFAKDIMRMDETQARQFTDFYKTYGGVIGGSAASYTQVLGARQPRDLDYFMQRFLLGTEKKVSFAKSILPTRIRGKHLIDIHGKEMYYWGRYHRFGFVSKRSVKIGDYRYFTAGEQTFRKGVSSVLVETRYRHGLYPGFPKAGTMKAQKDVFDFVTHANSQILSLQQSISPLSQWKASRAAAALDIFLHPMKAKGFGKTKLGSIDSFFKYTTKQIQPKTLKTPWGYDYLYPKSAYPSYSSMLGLGGYSAGRLYQYKTTIVKPYTAPSIMKGTYPLINKKIGEATASLQQLYVKMPKTSKKSFDYTLSFKTEIMPSFKTDIGQYYQPSKKGYLTSPSILIPSYDKMITPYMDKVVPYPYGDKVVSSTIKRISDSGGGIRVKRKGQGFDVYVKDRYIYQGKPRKREQFKKVNVKPVSYDDAMSFGATVVDKTAGATFKVKPASKKAQELHPNIEASISSWDSLAHKFYSPPKRKKSKDKHKVHVEKTAYRIDSKGEVKGISSLGWVAERRKKTPKTSRSSPSLFNYSLPDTNSIMNRMLGTVGTTSKKRKKRRKR